MKKFISVLLAFTLASSVWAEDATKVSQSSCLESSLNISAHYLEMVISNVQTSLEQVALTPECKKGDWKGIKQYLKLLKTDLPGVCFYMLPDGNYYSVERDFTNLNLSNRAYFQALFAGTPVRGYPVYSRSTGRKSALVAVPVWNDGKVIGALGISIFLEELNAKINRALDLPQDYVWYVLNDEGNTIMHQERDLIFVDALKQGGKSLREAIAASGALNRESGKIQYELNGTRTGYFQKLPNMDWWLFLVKIEGAKITTQSKMKLSLENFVTDLQQELNLIDVSLERRISETEVDVGNESEIRKVLWKLLDENFYIIEAAFVDIAGFLRYIEPADYKNFENTDISNQAHIIRMRENPKPQFIYGITVVEGFQAAIIAHPLFESEIHYAGRINLLFSPELMINSILKRSIIPDDYELWIMQPDGMIVYDQDKDEIGKMLFNDPIYASYESLLRLGKTISYLPSGEGSYIFLAHGSNERVIKNAIWKTVRLHNREWRVVLAYRPFE